MSALMKLDRSEFTPQHRRILNSMSVTCELVSNVKHGERVGEYVAIGRPSDMASRCQWTDELVCDMLVLLWRACGRKKKDISWEEITSKMGTTEGSVKEVKQYQFCAPGLMANSSIDPTS